MRDLLFLTVMLGTVPLALRFPMVGVMGWVWTATLSPNDWLYGYMVGIPINRVYAVATLIGIILSLKTFRLQMSRELWIILGLLVVGTASAMFSIDQGDAGWNMYIRFVKILMFPFAIAMVVTTRLRMQALLLAMALGVGFVGVSEGAFYLATGGGHVIKGNPSIGDNNQLAAWLVTIIPSVLYLCNQSLDRLVKIIGFIAVGLIVTAVVGTFSRGGLIGLVALGGLTLIRSRRKFLGFAGVAVAVIVIVIAAPETWFSRIDTIGEATSDSSFMGRVVAWKVSTMMALDRPLIGGGFHAVQHPFAWNLYGHNMALLDFITTPPVGAFPRAAHSIYFEMLGDLGFTGLLLFSLLMGSILINGRAVRRMAAARPDLDWAADLASTLQTSLVVFAVTGAALSISYSDQFYVMVAMAFCLRRIVALETQDSRQMGRSLAPIRPPGIPAVSGNRAEAR